MNGEETPRQIAQGECIESIAFESGHLPETIWNHGQNLELRKNRKSMRVLLPGDELFVPEVEAKWADRSTDAKHRFRRRGFRSRLKVRVLDHDEPMKGRRYLLTIEGSSQEGTVDGDGWINVLIPSNARTGELVVGPGEDGERRWSLELGHLDPDTESSGVRHRLTNLGFLAEDGDEEALAEALRAFQKKGGLPATGEADPATRDRLRAVHGS